MKLGLISLAAIGVQFLLAYRFKVLSVGQMRDFQKSLPYSAHPALYLDLLLVTPLLAYISDNFGANMLWRQIVWYALAAIVVSIALHWLWVIDAKDYPSFTSTNGRINVPGVWHLLYLAFALTVFLWAFFGNSGVTKAAAGRIALVLAGHVLVGSVWPNIYLGRPIFVPGTVAAIGGGWLAIAIAYLYANG